MTKTYYSLFVVALLTLFSFGNKVAAQDCSADFNYMTDGPDAAFNGFATGLSPSYFWSFGDGTYAYTEDPEHTYATNGNYLVCFTVYAADSCTSTYCDSVEITGAAGGDCNALFTFDVFGATLSFTNLSTPADVSSFWNFGDGSSSYLDDPSHTFDPGTYNVCLTVFGADSCISEYCQTITIFGGGDSTGCSAYFTFDESDGTVEFTNLSDADGFPADYVWEFGDGETSFAVNPTHTYDEGIYVVCLTIYTADSCSSTYCNTITIGEVIIDSGFCNANYVADITGGLAEFTNTSTTGGADILTYFWDFGDGSISTLENPNHGYSISGMYNVCLSISTTDSCESMYCHMYSITLGDTATECNASFNYDFGITPWGIFTTNLSADGGVAASYFWDFGDGSSSTEFEPAHNYAAGGSYVICLTITTAFCTDTDCDTVMIAPTGIDDILFNNDLAVYPNPATKNIVLMLKSDVNNHATIIISDISGRNLQQVYSGNLNDGENEFSINIESLQAGMYLINVINEDGSVQVTKFIKQ